MRSFCEVDFSHKRQLRSFCEVDFLAFQLENSTFATNKKLNAMKKLSATCFATLISMASLANCGVVTLQTDDKDFKGHKERTEGQIPVVPFDDNSVYLRTDSGAVAAHVTITGTGGTVMYSGTTVITPSVQAISAPNIAGEEKYMIEITTDRRRLYGYFM